MMGEWLTPVLAIGGVVVWVARLEFRVSSAERAVADIKAVLKILTEQSQEGLQRLARIEGRLNGKTNGR